MDRRFLQELENIFPADRLLTRDVELLPYETDGLTAFQTKPGAAVIPIDDDEVIATVRLCHERAVPFVARGSGTSLSGGSVPIADGLTIALNRLNRIKRIDPDQRIAVVEPGVINLHITQAAQDHLGCITRPIPPANLSARSAEISLSTAAARIA